MILLRPVGRDFDNHVALAGPDCPEPNARFPGGVRPPFQECCRVRRCRVGGDINVTGVGSKK